MKFDDAKRTLSFQPSRDLTPLLKRELASEMWPTDNQFALSADKAVVDAAIQHARDANAWPQVHFLWPLHPIAQWLDFKLMALFGRQRAPVVRAQQGLAAGEAIVLVLAQVPNRRGQTMLTEWMGVHLDPPASRSGVLSFDAVLRQTGLGSSPMANDGQPTNMAHVQAALPAVVQMVERHLKPIKQAFDADCRVRLERELAKLKTLQHKHHAQMELDFANGLEQVMAGAAARRRATPPTCSRTTSSGSKTRWSWTTAPSSPSLRPSLDSRQEES